MKVYVYCLVAALLGTAVAWGQVDGVPRTRPEIQDGMEVLTRGPVHEAFAETVIFDPEPGIVTPKMPPAAIEEVPPEQRPEGTNVAWIPGYWAWDDERTDFLWVSGVWRALADEMVELVDQCTAADVVCISATPPAAVMHARYLSKRLHGRLPEANLIVGLWDAQGDLIKARERIGCDAIVVATLPAAEEQIGTQIQSNVPRPHTQTPSERDPRVMAGTH